MKLIPWYNERNVAKLNNNILIVLFLNIETIPEHILNDSVSRFLHMISYGGLSRSKLQITHKLDWPVSRLLFAFVLYIRRTWEQKEKSNSSPESKVYTFLLDKECNYI